jgi:hypothetical protein
VPEEILEALEEYVVALEYAAEALAVMAELAIAIFESV